MMVFLGSLSYAQELNFRNYTVEDVLPQTDATFIYSDSKGFLWITSQKGVSRFDEKNFKTYGKEDGKEDLTISSFSSQGIQFLEIFIG
jgi:ligand-binding sensor domain-containing protein